MAVKVCNLSVEGSMDGHLYDGGFETVDDVPIEQSQTPIDD